MVKPLPDVDTAQAEALEVLQSSLGRFGEFVENQWVKRFAGSIFDPGIDLKLRFQVTRGLAKGSAWWIHVLIKNVVQPRQATSAIWSLKRSVETSVNDEPVYPILIAPFISESVAQKCEDEQIGHLDLAGNCNIEFGGIWVHRQGLPRKYKELRPQKSLFTPKATRILRVLLQGPLQTHKVEEIAETAGVSLGLVSKVRRLLLDEELAVEEKGGIKIKRPQEILRDWNLADDFRKRVETREYSLLEQDHSEIARILHRELGHNRHAFTQWTAAHLRKPHVPPQITSLYVESFPDEDLLKRVLKVRRVDSGGRLWLHRPADEGVFIGRQKIGDLPLVSDVQIYLDLLDSGNQLRANEAARELREDTNFNGGW